MITRSFYSLNLSHFCCWSEFPNRCMQQVLTIIFLMILMDSTLFIFKEEQNPWPSLWGFAVCAGAAPWHGVICQSGWLATGEEETHREDSSHFLLVWLQQYQRYCHAHLRPDWICPWNHGKVRLSIHCTIGFGNHYTVRAEHRWEFAEQLSLIQEKPTRCSFYIT